MTLKSFLEPNMVLPHIELRNKQKSSHIMDMDGEETHKCISFSKIDCHVLQLFHEMDDWHNPWL